MNVTIRQATQADALEIARIYQYYVEQTTISFETTAPGVEEMCRRIDLFTSSGFPYLVAEAHSRILGYAYAHPWKERDAYRHTWETTVYVKHGEQAKGVGKRLMQALIDIARNLECHALIACITAENIASRLFHESLGFQMASEFHQVGFKQGRYLDVTDYQLILSTIADKIEAEMLAMRDDAQASHLMKFFKCGKGEYGEGDLFLGIRVPQTRNIVKAYRSVAHLSDALKLVKSPWHEVRLAGFLLMVELYRQQKKKNIQTPTRKIVDAYLSSLDKANNWDLIDLSAPYILGDWLVTHPQDGKILHQLSRMKGNLWHQRAAIVATLMLIRNRQYNHTFKIAEKYLSHTHDLIHKATGWMLREAGKHGGHDSLTNFLDHFAHIMPRTMLRYAIEKFPDRQRKHYMMIKK